MVRFATLFLCILQLTINEAADPPGGYYTTRYDHLDIENILNQKRLVKYYAACLLDRGPCTPQGIEFKNILPEAIKTNCLRCTEKQRVVTLRSIRRLQKEYPDIWAQLQESWDPTGAYIKRLEASANKPIPIRPTSETNNTMQEALLLSNRFAGETEYKRVAESSTTERATTSTSSGTSSTTPGATTSPSGISRTTPGISLTSSERTLPATSPRSTTLTLLVSTLKPKKATTARFSTSTSFYHVTKRIVVRPFSSIGPNLVVPNPKAIIDKVISTAGAVLNSVTNTVTNTVVTVFKG